MNKERDDLKQEIRCPLCEWKPQPEDRWACAPGCGTAWNTFWTRGMCPGCGKQWSETQCLACRGISLHRKWYRSPQGTGRKSKKVKEPA